VYAHSVVSAVLVCTSVRQHDPVQAVAYAGRNTDALGVQIEPRQADLCTASRELTDVEVPVSAGPGGASAESPPGDWSVMQPIQQASPQGVGSSHRVATPGIDGATGRQPALATAGGSRHASTATPGLTRSGSVMSSIPRAPDPQPTWPRRKCVRLPIEPTAEHVRFAATQRGEPGPTSG
jgi:hypothetical protein